MEIFLIAGEPSGDVLGAELIKALRLEHKNEDIKFVGVGGELMKKQGMEVLLPLEELNIMGILEVIPQIPRMLGIIKSINKEIIRRKPSVLVTIDFPDFNFVLGKKLKKLTSDIPHIHCVAPSVWAWRGGRAKKIAKFLDGLICLLPFELPYFQKYGLPCVFAGHPIMNADKSDKEANRVMVRQSNGIADDTKVLGLLMGSRRAEIENCGNIMVKAAVLVREKIPNIHLIVPTLPSLEYEVTSLLSKAGLPSNVVVDEELKLANFAAMDGAIAVSGTVGLELAALKIPHVIAYKTSPITWKIGKMMTNVKYAHLANIVLDEEIVPEFLQKNCDPEKLADGVVELLQNADARKSQIDGFSRLDERFAIHGSGTHIAAKFILNRSSA